MDQVSLAQRAYDQLYEKLRSGSLRPGARLVNRTLATELGTSTIPVREAIGRLVSEGLLDFTPGAGAFVRSPDPNELGELYDVREALEVLAASEAARFADEHLVTELRGVCEQFRQIAETIPAGKHATATQFHRWLQCEEQFHGRLVAASRNRWLVKVVREIRVIATVFAAQRSVPKLLTHALARATVRNHEAFLKILTARDSEQARKWMTKHIHSGRNTVLTHVAAEAARQPR